MYHNDNNVATIVASMSMSTLLLCYMYALAGCLAARPSQTPCLLLTLSCVCTPLALCLLFSYGQRYRLRVCGQVPACGDNYSMNTMLRGQFNFTGTVVSTHTHTTTTLHSFARLVEVLPRQAQAMHSQPRDAIDTTVPKQAQSVCMRMTLSVWILYRTGL